MIETSSLSLQGPSRSWKQLAHYFDPLSHQMKRVLKNKDEHARDSSFHVAMFLALFVENLGVSLKSETDNNIITSNHRVNEDDINQIEAEMQADLRRWMAIGDICLQY